MFGNSMMQPQPPPIQSMGGGQSNAFATQVPGRAASQPRFGLAGTSIRAPGAGGTNYRQQYATQMGAPDQGGVTPGSAVGPNAVQQAYQQGPSLAQIQAEMARRNVGAQLNQNPANSALAGYMMG